MQVIIIEAQLKDSRQQRMQNKVHNTIISLSGTANALVTREFIVGRDLCKCHDPVHECMNALLHLHHIIVKTWGNVLTLHKFIHTTS